SRAGARVVIVAILASPASEADEVVREGLDVLRTQRARDAGHVAGIAGALPRLEVRELLDDVGVVLPGDARDLVLAEEAAEVAHRAQRLVRRRAPQPGLGGVGLERLRRRLLLREVVGERSHLVARQVLGHWRHLRIAASAFLEV